MREKLIDIVEAYADFLDWDTKEEMVDSIMEFLATDNNVGDKWIPVTERLPEECGFYICFFQSPYGNGCCRVGQCHWNEESWVRFGAVPPHVIVTHWMPLPEPPKVE